MTRIFFWAADSGGCCHYRCDLPATALAGLGHQTLVTNLMPDAWRDADVIVGQRVANPGPSKLWQQLAKQGRSKLVFEVDDDLFNTDQTNVNVHSFFSNPEIRENLRRNIAVADVVTVSTEALAETIRPLNPRVIVVPNLIPQWVLDLPSPALTGRVTVGWGGGPTHQRDWTEAASEVARFITRNPQTSFHLMGPPLPGMVRSIPPDQLPPPDLMRALPAAQVRCTEWIQSVPDYYRAIDFNIGLAPLRANVFNRSKSHIKALEYAALGIPCVASDVGPYPDFVRHGETGFLVRRPHEWAKYLRELLDPVVRQEMGAKARAVAAEHTVERHALLWEAALCR